ncbi:FecR family protein [Chitinophaga silvatica]|uniref:FecR family protein n=1 Tax=Chitinophaga silvatica TaxID=2282649 RepID=A0A3E1YG00_9BACT|nr:FecR family protein [Chitinophaga silvatica]RFS26296.1 FecR family protein [Chitinophaga silvatica]
MKENDFEVLFQKYLDDKISQQELHELEDHLKNNYPAAEIDKLWRKALEEPYTGIPSSNQQLEIAYAKVKPAFKVVRHSRYQLLKYAAAIAVLAVAGRYLYQYRTNTRVPTPVVAQNVIMPAAGAVTLTLADGSVVEVDSLGNQTILQGASVNKSGDELVYNSTSGDAGSLNILSTPRGRQFQVKLADGTRVWLNAASSITYPTAFTGATRKVKVIGEAYFEVAQNPQQPFEVTANRAIVQVLGTSFNINAYDSAQISTTLLEGAIKISANDKNINPVILKPGQESRLTTNITVINQVDTDRTLAWKKGYFNFEGASLHQVLDELQRWYDIEVVYEENAKNIRFGGALSRNKSLDNIISALKDSEVHFRLEGRKLIVLP